LLGLRPDEGIIFRFLIAFECLGSGGAFLKPLESTKDKIRFLALSVSLLFVPFSYFSSTRRTHTIPSSSAEKGKKSVFHNNGFPLNIPSGPTSATSTS
jgi:hypothetical protein